MEIGAIGEGDRDFQHFLNKIVFLNNDFMKKHILKLERKIQAKDEELNKKSSDMLELKQQMQRLERVNHIFFFKLKILCEIKLII